jgi:hypothetical protein
MTLLKMKLNEHRQPYTSPTYILTYLPTYPFIINITILDEKVHYKKLHHMIKWNEK